MTRVFVGNLPMDVRERELGDFFYRFGKITDIEVNRPQRPPAFAFVSFADLRDARDAVHYRDGVYFDGARLRVELQGGRGGGSRQHDGDRAYTHSYVGNRNNGGKRCPVSKSRRGEEADHRRKKRRREESGSCRDSEGGHGGGGCGGGGGGVKKRDDSDGSHDDTVGSYTGGKGDVIAGTYEVLSEVGVGTFGRVLECFDLKTAQSSRGAADGGSKTPASNGSVSACVKGCGDGGGEGGGGCGSSVDLAAGAGVKRRKVAIKVVRRIKRYTESAAIEAGILLDVDTRQRALGSDLCVSLLTHFEFEGHFCLVFESLGRSLFDYLKKNDYHPFPFPTAVAFTRQMLQALEFLHKMDLCHTDLKPENVLAVTTQGERLVDNGYGQRVLVPASTKIKLIDFGGSTYDSDKHKSSVVNTRQYRAPEVILGLGWSTPSDCWSVGCIAAELYQGELLFATHGNTEHLALMERRVGPFPPSMVKISKERKKYFSSSSSSSSAGREESGGGGGGESPRVRVGSLSSDAERFVRKCGSLEDAIRPEHKNRANTVTENTGGGGRGKEEEGDDASDGNGGRRGWLELLQGLLTLDPAERASAHDALQWRWNQAPLSSPL